MTVEMSLFAPDLPEGFRYRDDFITAAEERALVEAIRMVEFADFEMRGAVARRRVAFYGLSYDSAREAQGPIPEFLSAVRTRAAEWAGIAASELVMALINEYRPGAPIGWHRDAPQYGIVVGISLLSACRMKLRPYAIPQNLDTHSRRPARKTTHEITLLPRSAYVIAGVARHGFEHSIPGVTELRYSITFRTLRR